MNYPIVINAALCLGCRQVLLSASRHDFRSCECGNFVDGGNDYLRRGVHIDNSQGFDELSIVLVDGKLRLAKDMV